MDDKPIRYASSEESENNFRETVDRAVRNGDFRMLTTLQSFFEDREVLYRCLDYAHRQGVDVMIAADSDGTFW
ncbi:MAG: hypothetical protein ACYDA2_04280 [Acidimicrobiales bacterium]